MSDAFVLPDFKTLLILTMSH